MRLTAPSIGSNARICVKAFTVLSVSAAILFFIFVVPTVSSRSEPPEIKVEVIPASVEIPPVGEIQVQVVTQNSTSGTLKNLQLTWFTSASVDISEEKPKSDRLGPYGTLIWTLRFSRGGPEPPAGTVHLRLDYTWTSADQTEPISRVAFSSLEVTPYKPQPVEQIANVEVETALTSLAQHRPGTVHLVVTNISDVPITVTKIVASGPDFATLTSSVPSSGAPLGPQETCAFPVTVTVSDTVRPGKYLLLFQIPLVWEKAGHAWAGTVVTSCPVEAGVMGESEILTILQLPSLLFLPGFLIIVTADWLWRIRKPRNEKERFLLKAKTVEFWCAVIVLSLAAAITYPSATECLTGVRRDYLVSYGFTDIVWIGLGSVLLTMVVCAVAIVLIWLYARLKTGGRLLYQRLNEWWFIPSATDSPTTVLNKLHRQHLGPYLERVDVVIDDELQRAYLIESEQEAKETVLVGPTVVVEELKGSDPALLEKINAQLVPKGSAKTLAKLLKEGHRKGYLRIRWKPMGQIRRPYQVKVIAIQERLDPNIIVEME